MLPVIHLGPAAIQSFVLALLVALWVGSFVSERACQRRGIDGNAVWNVVGIGVVVTIVSARIVFALQNWGVYANDVAQILSPTPSALSLDYGALCGIIAAYAYIQRRKIPFARFADALAPGALIAIALIAFGQFLSGDAFGTPTDLPWDVSFWGDLVHPVQLYDAFAALLGLIIVWRIRASRDGLIARVAIAWYSAARLFIDAFRGDAALIGNGYRLSQVLALIILISALWFIGQKGEAYDKASETQTNRERAGG